VGIIIPTDELIFFRGVETTNQNVHENTVFWPNQLNALRVSKLGHVTIWSKVTSWPRRGLHGMVSQEPNGTHPWIDRAAKSMAFPVELSHPFLSRFQAFFFACALMQGSGYIPEFSIHDGSKWWLHRFLDVPRTGDICWTKIITLPTIWW
jgi:hypothetical protein